MLIPTPTHEGLVRCRFHARNGDLPRSIIGGNTRGSFKKGQ